MTNDYWRRILVGKLGYCSSRKEIAPHFTSSTSSFRVAPGNIIMLQVEFLDR
jgi:hypothetical protein